MNEELIKTPKESDNIVGTVKPIQGQKFVTPKDSMNGLFRLITLCLTLIISLAILSTAVVKYKQVSSSNIILNKV